MKKTEEMGAKLGDNGVPGLYQAEMEPGTNMASRKGR